MRIIVISATSVLARHCVENWAKRANHEFVLIGRDRSRIQATVDDLAIRFPGSSFVGKVLDFADPAQIQKVIDSLSEKRNDLVLIAQGSGTSQILASNDFGYLAAELELNAVSVALFTEGFTQSALNANHGTIGVFGSVAGDRGRAYNYAYGAAKGLIEVFTEGLQQRVAKSAVSVCLIKPGPTKTPMTRGHQGKFADPSKVARVIVEGLARKSRVIYAPRGWRLVMFVVRLIPFVIFKKLRF
jgi:decaprenylphospho-beta-D-erythro-pentofuranosid-2-ulose 2-reductase